MSNLNGIVQNGTYNTLNDWLARYGREQTREAVIMREIDQMLTFSPLLPIAEVTGDKDGGVFTDVGTYRDPYVYNRASNLMAPDGGRLEATYGTYQRFDTMAMRGGQSTYKKPQMRMAPQRMQADRLEKLLDRVRDTALDIEHDLLYGDYSRDTLENTGIYARFQQITDRRGVIKSGADQGKMSRYITIDAGGTGDDLSSIFIMVPDAQRGVCRLFPKSGTDISGTVKVQMGKMDLSEEWLRKEYVQNGHTFNQEYTIDQFDVAFGIAVKNRGACIRIANIDWTDSSATNILKVRRAYMEAMSAVDKALGNRTRLVLMNSSTRINLAAFADQIILENQTTAQGVNGIVLSEQVAMPRARLVECDWITEAEDQVA